MHDLHLLDTELVEANEEHSVHAEAVKDVLTTGDCSPLDLPPDLYEEWSEIIIAVR